MEENWECSLFQPCYTAATELGDGEVKTVFDSYCYGYEGQPLKSEDTDHYQATSNVDHQYQLLSSSSLTLQCPPCGSEETEPLSRGGNIVRTPQGVDRESTSASNCSLIDWNALNDPVDSQTPSSVVYEDRPLLDFENYYMEEWPKHPKADSRSSSEFESPDQVSSSSSGSGRRGRHRGTAPYCGSRTDDRAPSIGPCGAGTEKARQTRQAANVRERRRMRTMNAAFDRLRARIPVSAARNRKLTKVDTLRLAIAHIQQLAALVTTGNGSEDDDVTAARAQLCDNDDVLDVDLDNGCIAELLL